MARLAMVFPGQGSQSVGMMSGYGDLASIRAVIAEASDVLRQDMAKLMVDGPTEADGLAWWKLQNINDANDVGWAAGDYLKPTTAP